jgi:hypothetical protein
MNDVKKVAFISRRFQELMGLQSAMFGAGVLSWLLLQGLAQPGLRTAPYEHLGWVQLSLMMAVALEARYRATFGRSVSARPGALVSYLITSPMFLLLIGIVADFFNDGRWLGPSFPSIGLTFGSAIVLARDFRWRPHYAALLTAGLLSGAVTNAAAPPDRVGLYVLGYAVMALGVIVAGVCDYRLLTSLVTDAPSSRTAAAGARHPRLLRIMLMLCATAAIALALPGPFGLIPLATALLIGSWRMILIGGQGLMARLSVLGLNTPEVDEAADQEPPFFESTWSLASVIALATGATADAARPGHPPVFLAIAFSACATAWAFSDWTGRKHYLAVAVAALFASAVASQLDPLRAFSLIAFIVTAATAVAIWIDGSGEPSRLSNVAGADA